MIQTADLRKKYRQVEALRGVTMALPTGGATALIGPNGAGKSTLIRVLMNLIEPTAGSATVLGVDSRKISPRELAQIGYVAESQQMPARLTVGEYIAYLRPFYPRWDVDMETALLRRMDLPVNRKIGNLSHGMRMKMGLVCALPFRPALLILDEPLSGLDPMSRDDLIAGLLEQAEETTILISSQEIGEIETLATHVILLNDGRVECDESLESLTGRFREVRVTLEQPAAMPLNPDAGWMRMESSGNVFSFVETRYAEEHLNEQIAGRIAGVRRIEVQPMPLRSVFTTLARARQGRVS